MNDTYNTMSCSVNQNFFTDVDLIWMGCWTLVMVALLLDILTPTLKHKITHK